MGRCRQMSALFKIAPSRWSKRVRRQWFPKEARVKEEVVVNKDVRERNQKVSDTVRRTEVEVEDERTKEVLLRRLVAEGNLDAKQTPASRTWRGSVRVPRPILKLIPSHRAEAFEIHFTRGVWLADATPSVTSIAASNADCFS